MSTLIHPKQFEIYRAANKGFCSKCLEYTLDECDPAYVNYDCPKCQTNRVVGMDVALTGGLLKLKIKRKNLH